MYNIQQKNSVWSRVQPPNNYVDFSPKTLAMMRNQFNWAQDKPLRHWIRENRLEGFTKLSSSVDKEDQQKMKIMQRIQNNAMPAITKLQQFNVELAQGAENE